MSFTSLLSDVLHALCAFCHVITDLSSLIISWVFTQYSRQHTPNNVLLTCLRHVIYLLMPYIVHGIQDTLAYLPVGSQAGYFYV